MITQILNGGVQRIFWNNDFDFSVAFIFINILDYVIISFFKRYFIYILKITDN
jgi:hypothetical protein